MLVARSRAFSLGTIVLLLAGGLATAMPVNADRDRNDAREFERAGQWDRACEAYLRLLSDDRNQPEVRDRLVYCLRRWQQARRHADPDFRKHVAAMPLSQALTIYSDVVAILQRYYVDSSRIDAARLWRSSLEEISNALSDPKIVSENAAAVLPKPLAEFRDRLRRELVTSDINDVRDLRSSLRDLAWEAQGKLGINPSLIVLEGACGACQGMDEFTSFVPPGRPIHEAANWNGDLAAFGIVVAARDGLVIDRVSPGSWAAAQGLQSGDRILRIGRISLEGLPAEAALELVRGERPLVSDLTIAGAGMSEPRVMTLPDSMPSVFDVAMERDGVGSMRIGSFQRTTPQEFDSAVHRLRAEGMKALILDLRGNPGGSFPAAVQIAERLISDGVIVSTHGQLRGLSRLFRSQNQSALDFPMVVLIDGDTASAAEVLAGALKDHHRALLVGQPTYGKDTIQRWWHTSAGGAVQLTLARFVLPSGRPFAGIGVSPNMLENRRDPMRDMQYEAAFEQAARMASLR